MATRSNRRFHVSALIPIGAAFASAAVLYSPAWGTFVSPVSWERGAGATTYQAWNAFTDPVGEPGNPPDVQSINPNGTANLVQNADHAFLTSGGNIYSFSGPTDFTVTVPELDVPVPPHNVTAIVQIRTLGTELDYGSLLLNGVAPADSAELERIELGGLGGFQVDAWFLFKVPYASFGDGTPGVGNLTLTFAASESSMSLDQLAIDTAIRPFGFFDEPNPVPEPGAFALIGVAGCALLRRVRTSR